MKKICTIIVALVGFVACVRSACALSVKLPYAKGQSFVVTQGYNSPPTHIKKDSYALDLTQNGCDAYGKAAVAAAGGRAMFVGQDGYNGGYGTELIIDHGLNIVSRYAHMIPDSITVAPGSAVTQGQVVGRIGDTGLVAGVACPAHPGTHIHFAMDIVDPDGTFSAYDPEPISGYRNVTEGNWYLSDNAQDETVAIADTSPIATVSSTVIVKVTSGSVSSATTSTSSNIGVPSGSVFVTSATAAPAPVLPLVSQPASTTNDANASLATSSVVASGTLSDILFEQLGDSAYSSASYYDDNWFEMGNGFSGMLTSLTLEGAVNNPEHTESQITLQEFKDKDYTAMVQEFPIADDAPFTPVIASATFNRLSILLKPYFYYRLSTLQDMQNRSVILAGTATTTTGTVMWNNFIYGTGRVEYTTPFFPFIVMQGAAATSTLTPPPLTVPSDIKEDFDALNMLLNVTWSTSTDPDWPANPLHYQMNYSTSTAFSDNRWIDPGPIPVVTGNSYLIGIRALDGYGAVSAPATATWNFPPGFVSYLVSPELNYAYQYFTVPATSTLQSIQLFTKNFQTGARSISNIFCYLQVFDEYDLSSLGMTPADSGATGIDCGNNPVFTFGSSPLMLYPDHRYHWVFTASTGNPLTTASVQLYGTAMQTADSPFSDPSLGSARFTVTGDSGVLFSN